MRSWSAGRNDEVDSAPGFQFFCGPKCFLYQLKSLVLAGRVLEGIQPALLASLKDLIRELALLSVFLWIARGLRRRSIELRFSKI